MAEHSGRRGRPWQRVRQQVLCDGASICWLCGHPGAGDVDHDPPRVELLRLGLDPEDPQYLRPAHGATSRCPTCGRCCNNEKGAGPALPRAQASRAW